MIDKRWLDDKLLMIIHLTCMYIFINSDIYITSRLLDDQASFVNGDINGFLLDDKHWWTDACDPKHFHQP